jgi:hypothetical protein
VQPHYAQKSITDLIPPDKVRLNLSVIQVHRCVLDMALKVWDARTKNVLAQVSPMRGLGFIAPLPNRRIVDLQRISGGTCGPPGWNRRRGVALSIAAQSSGLVVGVTNREAKICNLDGTTLADVTVHIHTGVSQTTASELMRPDPDGAAVSTVSAATNSKAITRV